MARYLFAVGRQAVQQAVENTGLFARRHEVAEQLVEVLRILAEGLIQTRPRLDLKLDVAKQPGHGTIGSTLADDVEGLEQRNARLHHRRELTCEQRDVLLGDLAATAEAALLDLGDQNPLAPERCLDHCFAAGAHFTAHDLAALVLAFPVEHLFLGTAVLAYGSGCGGQIRLLAGHSRS